MLSTLRQYIIALALNSTLVSQIFFYGSGGSSGGRSKKGRAGAAARKALSKAD